MGERAGILGELHGAKHAHVLDTLDRRASDVGGKALVAKDREAFLEAELEPVAAGHPVARPIMKIFMRHYSRDIVEIGIGRSVLIGEHVG